ncbi:hypothetical protein [Streptomyces sp. 891-h]|uniref:hypothetical protein n=1 Tax=Streptomyces sp. 891-h TaxID=2720714 RepID=UPI001FAB275D|nr:hypothetical protein [Streptomyces sp. 891-h]UNZ16058.1 hypothetical protein HC362_02055 [Streptomyces sp. 891-h]
MTGRGTGPDSGGRSGGGPDRYEGRVQAGPGGVMTDEVGVITGEVTVVTRSAPGGRAAIDVQYTGAEEWYTLTGSPVPLPPGGLAALHTQVVDLLRRGGAARAPR